MTPSARVEPEPVLHRIAENGRLLGFVAIDSTIDGRARGGLRLASDLGEDEIRAAARSMTLKYGLLGLPQGGAKAGVIGDPEAPEAERRATLLRFGRAALELLRSRAYVPDADLGTSDGDIRALAGGLGLPLGPRDWRGGRSGEYTAWSCLGAAQALLGRQGRSMSGARVAIEGFGKVGSALARLVAERAGRVVAVSTSHGALVAAEGLDVVRLAQRAAQRGSAFVEEEPERAARQELLELPVDVLFPCARFHSLSAENAPRIAARVVCSGANNSATPAAERVLFEKGVVCLPDFVTNCGGVLGGTLEFAGVEPARIGPLVAQMVGAYVSSLVARAEHLAAAPRAVAEEEARARHAAVGHAVRHPSLVQRGAALAIEAYRRGLVPAALVSRVAPRYLGRWCRP